MWYGLSTILARLISYIQTPLVTYKLSSRQGMEAYGDFSLLYAGISILNIVFTYGMETAFFRFASAATDRKRLFETSFCSLLCSTVILSIVFILLRHPLAHFIEMDAHPEYITWCILVIAFDTLSAIPFARLRQEGRPRKYAAVRIAGVVLNLVLVVFFIYVSDAYANSHPENGYALWFRSHSAAGLMVLANLAQSVLTFLLLFNEWRDFRFGFDRGLWTKLWKYGSPMIITGLGGMVNETLDRFMLLKLYPGSDAAKEVGIYSANYKLAIFITLFVQAFKMGAEPFFFNQASDKNAPATYARVMKWFVVTLCIAFLFTGLYLDVWKYLVGAPYRGGLGVVPVLLFANICLGIYYNLAVWYKVSDRMRMGAFITLIGAAITIGINVRFIPLYGMHACAWATCICYFVMMVLCYVLGQKYFPVPYPVKKIVGYLLVTLGLYFIQVFIQNNTYSTLLHLVSASVLMTIFFMAVIYHEKTEMGKMPFIGRYLKRG